MLTFDALQPLVATAQQTKAAAASAFSFIAYGDSRPMMNIPSKDGKPEVTKLLAESFGIVLPEKIAEEIVQKDVKMTFDPVTKELIQLVMPFMTKSEVTTLKVNKGWVTEATVEDVKLLPGVHRTMFRFGRRRLGGARDREGRPVRTRQIRGQRRRRRVVGKSGPHRHRQPVLAARK